MVRGFCSWFSAAGPVCGRGSVHVWTTRLAQTIELHPCMNKHLVSLAPTCPSLGAGAGEGWDWERPQGPEENLGHLERNVGSLPELGLEVETGQSYGRAHPLGLMTSAHGKCNWMTAVEGSSEARVLGLSPVLILKSCYF